MRTIAVDDEGVWGEDGCDCRVEIRWDEIYAVSVYNISGTDEISTFVELDFDFGAFIELESSAAGFDAAVETIGGE